MNKIYRHRMAAIGLLLSVLLSSGCTGLQLEEDEQAKMSVQQEPPLGSNLDAKDEFRLLMDMVDLEIKQEQYLKAESLLQRLRKDHHDNMDIYRKLGVVYAKLDKGHLSLLAWREVIQSGKSNVDDQAEYARMALVEDEYQLAEVVYKNWLQQGGTPLQVTALNNLGFSKLLQKKYASAEAYFRDALLKDPLNTKALNNLLLVDSLLGK